MGEPGNWQATLGLTCAIIAVVIAPFDLTYLVMTVLGLVFGSMGAVRAREHEELGGYRRSVWALFLSLAAVGVMVLVFAVRLSEGA